MMLSSNAFLLPSGLIYFPLNPLPPAYNLARPVQSDLRTWSAPEVVTSPGLGSTTADTTLPSSMTIAARLSRGPPKTAWASRTRPRLEERAPVSSPAACQSLPKGGWEQVQGEGGWGMGRGGGGIDENVEKRREGRVGKGERGQEDDDGSHDGRE